MRVIFAVETEERSLYTFATAEEAVRHCEGLDVEAAIWLFWDDAGQPLEPVFSVPNKLGLLSVKSGVYSLSPTTTDHHACLVEVVDEILNFEAPAPFNSAAGVRDYLRSSR